MRDAALLVVWLTATACASRPPPRRPVAVEARARPPAPPPPAVAAAPVASPHVIARAELLDVLDRGIPWFLRQIDTEPALEGRRFVGFRLLAFFPNDPRFRRVDLGPGDVVLSVNGLPIERPEHAYRIWQELRVASDLRVEYLRAGQPRSIEYTIGDS